MPGRQGLQAASCSLPRETGDPGLEPHEIYLWAEMISWGGALSLRRRSSAGKERLNQSWETERPQRGLELQTSMHTHTHPRLRFLVAWPPEMGTFRVLLR